MDPEKKHLSPRLVILSGPSAGQTLPLSPAGLSIGRHADNGLQVRDMTASRQHCLVESVAAGFRLRDLGSRHGTFVNGRPVQERVLEDGDMIAVADTLLSFQAGENGADSVAPPVLAGEEAWTARTTVHLAPGESVWQRPADALDERAADPRILQGFQVLLRTAADLQSAGAFHLDRQGLAAPFPVSSTVVREVLAKGTALLADDVLLQEALATAESLRAARVRSLLAAPLVHLGQVLGLLYTDAGEPGGRFDHGHLELLAALGGIAAGALAGVRQKEWLEEENQRLAASLAHDLIGESPRMREVYLLLARAAASGATVLLRGESGTGKELAARALHHGSPRAGRAFVAVNCATLTETLLESELFGHERGAFTGAVERKIGKAEVADGGTLFLDEVGEIPLGLQAKLLRFLQEREVERVGGTRPIRVDVRLVAATNRDLERAVREGTFRKDLYYRLSVVPLHLPPLRDRREDIPLLASHFAALTCQRLGRPLAGFTPEARACLMRYDWPGNVRELGNAVERAIVLGEGGLIRPEDLPETLLEAGGAAPEVALGSYHETVQETKKQLILAAVSEAGGNITRAAARLGLQPTYLHRLIRNLDLRASSASPYPIRYRGPYPSGYEKTAFRSVFLRLKGWHRSCSRSDSCRPHKREQTDPSTLYRQEERNESWQLPPRSPRQRATTVTTTIPRR